MREWNGRTHEVEVLEDGFRWQGRTWNSLSRIAREITGSNWSGPRFFGLSVGRDQAFNSLDAQAEACAAYIASQKHEGWVLLPERYDDGGISGATLDRPAVQRLLADIDAGKIDRVVVYKVDRLTRSLTDFSKLVERFDAAGCSFVSVTQSFNTATSMGRLTLNMLLSFAQFEREVTAERIRDKIAASKKKGIWMGGLPPLGYDARDRSLVVNATEAETVRTLFDLYDRLGCVRAVKAEADHLRLVTKHRRFADGRTAGGVLFSRGRIYHLLSNPVYIGRIRHREKSHEGQHEAIIGQELWDQVQQKLTANAARARRKETSSETSPLSGKFRDETGDILTPSHAVKNGRRYRYYISRRLITRSGEGDLDGWRLPAPALEQAVVDLIRAWLGRSTTPAELLQDASASKTAALRTRLQKLAEDQQNPRALCALIASGRITPGHHRPLAGSGCAGGAPGDRSGAHRNHSAGPDIRLQIVSPRGRDKADPRRCSAQGGPTAAALHRAWPCLVCRDQGRHPDPPDRRTRGHHPPARFRHRGPCLPGAGSRPGHRGRTPACRDDLRSADQDPAADALE